MARRPKPFGKDRLGVLGPVFGANSAIADTDTEYRIGTNDYIYEFLINIEPGIKLSAYPVLAIEDTSDHSLYFNRSTDKAQVWLDGAAYQASVPAGLWGRWAHVLVFADRDGSAYIYIDGDYSDAVSIAAKDGVDINSDTLQCGGTFNAAYAASSLMLARLFILSGTFPTAGEMAAIARERFLNPDAESPTLAARANYATERRVDVDFNDTLYGATTVVNNGTGGNFTVGGGLNWEDVATRAERVSISIPSSAVYTLDATHTAQTAAEDYSLAVQPLIARFVHGDLRNPSHAGSSAGIQTAAGTAYIKLYATNPSTIQVQAKDAAGAVQSLPLDMDQLDIGDIFVVADGTDVKVYQNSQHIGTLTVGAAIDLTGNCQFVTDGKLRVTRHELWNPAAVPGTIVDDMKGMCMRPDAASATLGTPACDFYLDSSVVVGDLDIPNDGSGGGAGMVISGGDTYGVARRLLFRGRS